MNVLLLSFGMTLALTMLISIFFRRLRFLDKPHLYGYQREPVPYGTGVVFFLVFLFSALIFLEVDTKLVAVLCAGAILTTTCFIDDRCKLPAVPRLLIQIFCAAILVLAGISVPAITNPFGGPFVLDSIRWTFGLFGNEFVIVPLASLVAMFWIVLVINAMNWLDGAPGIVSGITTISCAVLYLLATMSDLHVIDQTSLATMALIIGGSSFAFLFFDFPVPKILMGDSGTMFLGMMIAVMAIYSGGKLATAFIVLAIPLLDAIWTIARRILKGQSPFRGDFQHFHHELMRAGLSERQVNLFYYVASLSFGIAALSLQSLGKLVAIVLLFALMVSIRLALLWRTK